MHADAGTRAMRVIEDQWMECMAAALHDPAFQDMLAAFHRAADALETFLRDPGDCPDADVRRVLLQQLQEALRIRYAALCAHLRRHREALPEL